MVGLAAFDGAHIRADFVRRVPAPAFDSMSGAERTEYLATHPESYTLVTRSPGDGGPEDDADPQRLIDLGGAALDRIVESGAFRPSDGPVMYLYRMQLDGHRQLGVVSLVAVDDYLQGRVKRHERVSSERARHLSNHFEQLGAQSSPIALGYRAMPSVRAHLDEMLERLQPVVDFVSGDGLEQTVWVVDDPNDHERLSAAFADTELYIMDGHHRAAAAGQLRERAEGPAADWMLGVLFADDRINIEPFHRRVRLAPDDDPSEVASRLHDALDLREDPSMATELPDGLGEVGVHLGGRWYRGTLPPPSGDVLSGVDPVRLQRTVIGPLLGVDPEHGADRIGYFLDSADRVALASASPDEVLFVLCPVEPRQVFEVADAGLDMPPKSTYVMPKPRSGVFLRRF